MNSRIMALSFTAIMLTAAMPASATHTQTIAGQDVPNVPALPHVRSTENCLPVGIDQAVLARVNQAIAGDPAFYTDDVGVSMLCLSGTPVAEWNLLVSQADAILQNLRNAAREVQRQVDYRLEATLPDSDYPNELVEPRTVLLDDTFNGHRKGGFGEWTIVTEQGDDPLWRLERTQTVNGTRFTYRFGEDDHYAHGAHEWLVSPEIDLTALKGNQSAIRTLVELRDDASRELRYTCNQRSTTPQPAPYGSGMFSPVCGETTGLLAGTQASPHILVLAYEAAFEDVINEQPVMQHGAYLDITYRLSMADVEDGVRMWVYTGDRAPDRRALFNRTLGPGDAWQTCPHWAADDLPREVWEANNDSLTDRLRPTCTDLQEGGYVVPGFEGTDSDWMPDVKRTQTFREADAPHPSQDWAFTGDVAEFKTARLNMTRWIDDRVWILFEVKTGRNDRGEDIFNDTSRFPRQKGYGFELSHVYVEGDGYLRNFRVKDVAATYPFELEGNPFGDSRNVRTTTPPGNAPLVAWVHNAGDSMENGTLVVTARGKSGSIASGDWTTLGDESIRVSLVPDEVKTITLNWSSVLTNAHPALREGWVYEVKASLVEEVNTTDVPRIVRDPVNQTLDPNNTAVRAPNAAGLDETPAGVGGAGNLTVTSFVRAASLRGVSLVRADGLLGNPLQLCSSVTLKKCAEHYAGRKGEPREVLVGVRNDGNAPQNITMTLKVELEGIEKPDTIVGAPTIVARDVLPGEVRAVKWNVVASQPGAYRVTAIPAAEVPAGALPPTLKNAERLLYVQRSTGIICLDTLEERECSESFRGGFVPELRLENITAATIAPDGTLYVATEIREKDPDTGAHSGQLAARDATGWRIVKNLSATLLNETFAGPPVEGYAYGSIRSIVVAPQTGALFLVGDNSTVLRLNASGALTRVGIEEAPGVVADPVQLTGAVWHKGTLLAAGHNGTLAFLNTSGTLERFGVTNTSYQNVSGVANVSVQDRYWGNFTSIALSAKDEVVAAGQGGVVLRHDAKLDMRAGWTEGRGMWGTGTRLIQDILGNHSQIGALGIHDDRVLLMGRGFMLASPKNATTSYANVTIPPSSPPGRVAAFVGAVEIPTGQLLLLDDAGQIITCEKTSVQIDACYDATVAWSYLLAPRPTAVGKGMPFRATGTILLVDDARTFLLGQAGLVLERLKGSLHDNELDWTVVADLAPRDGGVLQTRRDRDGSSSPHTTREQSIVLIPPDAQRPLAQQATKFRLYLNHSMNWTQDNAVVVSSELSGDAFAELRLLYRPVPNVVLSPAANTNAANAFGNQDDLCPPQNTTGDNTQILSDPCHMLTRHVPPGARFDQETKTAGWEAKHWPDLPVIGTTTNPIPGQDPIGLWFYGIEIYSRPGIRYAIDDIRLQGLVGTSWRDITAWYGPDSSKNLGSWFFEGIYEIANHSEPGPLPSVPTTAYQALAIDPQAQQWEEWRGPPFDLEGTSPWHLTTEYADRPVFAANNEFYKEGYSEPDAPRLLSHWDSRLVSPVIDLSAAYDPVIEWRQSYSFRTAFGTISTSGATLYDTASPGDGGFVEVQYLRRGAECDSPDVTITCGWSQWYPVRPEGGYPSLEKLGLMNGNYSLTGAGIAWPPAPGRIGILTGPGPASNDKDEEDRVSYWGRYALPDETGRVTGPRLTETYETQRVSLHESTCTDPERLARETSDVPIDCIPYNVTGTKIRVAFHLQTAGSYGHTDPANYSADSYYNGTGSGSKKEDFSFAGEGWYITDFKVLGAAKLGIDLEAKDLDFRVGYDVANIGVGPGTKVPINVTVVNNGAFEALGYEGRLEVRRVFDRALKISQLVDTIPLSQQPVLDAAAGPDQPAPSRNHTLIWNVPAIENAEYALRFILEPIGIDRDEDHLDNVVDLGTIARPTIAKTLRRFNTEFLVSPENATSDITRYIPMFVNNTGNVPLEGFEIERRIVATGRFVADDATTCDEWQQRVALGQPSAIVDCRFWTTQRAAPPGALSPLTLLSDEVSPTNDLFWKAPERATFIMTLAAQTQVGNEILASATDRRIAAFATYLFDDVEGGIRGDSRSGDWLFDGTWNASQPGFRSTDSYAFGDLGLDRYEADADDSLTTPTIDLGSARTAQLAFYHNYEFEPSFDGGIVEASDDGGKTWTALRPLSNGPASASYNDTFPIQASSPLHPNGDPETRATAFTHDSSNLPSSVDGWVLSQVDLTDYANVTETDVEYEAFHSAELARLTQPPPTPASGKNVYLAPDWCSGPLADGRCWSYENLTEGTIVPPTPKPAGAEKNTMWWSGSASRFDDQMRPITNNIILVEVDLSAVADDQAVIADWWEYADRFQARPLFYDTSKHPDAPTAVNKSALYTFQTFTTLLSPSETYRYNLGEAKIVDTQGQWFHMQSDLTPILKRMKAEGKGGTLTVGFSYTPLKKYHGDISQNYQAISSTKTAEVISNDTTADAERYGSQIDDRGFAIDGFKVEAIRRTGGQAQPPVVLIDEAQAWEKITARMGGGIWECGVGHPNGTTDGTNPWAGSTPSSGVPACFNITQSFLLREPLPDTMVEGRIWSEVSVLPGVDSPWQVVSVKDHGGYTEKEPQPTGDVPKAWYTGDLACRQFVPNERAANEHLCPHPASEARLITPIFDLARIAGDNAQLAFWHRFAFAQRNFTQTPLASGGVVEVSVLDPLTGKWGDWEQIYASDDMRIKDPESKLSVLRARLDGTRGGYTGYTANSSATPDGVRRYDPPFKNLVVPDRDDAVQYLYTGNSKWIESDMDAPHGLNDGWLRAEYDLKDYLGRKVRFGFHYYNSAYKVDEQSDNITGFSYGSSFTDPDAPGQGRRTGWWIGDVAIVGDVLVGKPVQLRFRAGTDGNVHDGHWQLDDVGVFGARYRNNVGIFVDQTPDTFGAYNSTVTEVPVTLRNLGDTVRRDLALEVRVAGSGATVSGLGPAGNATLEDGAFVFKGYTLGPGQAVVARVKVHTAKNFGDANSVDLVLQLKEENTQSQTVPFGAITNNEVQGLLTRVVNFTLQKGLEFKDEHTAFRQVTPAVGETVELVLSGRNTGFGPVLVGFECKARTVVEWHPVNHKVGTTTEDPDIVAEYPCSVEGKTSLARKEWTNITFRTTPTAAGFLQLVIRGNVSAPGYTKTNLSIPAAGVFVGVPPVTYRETFDRSAAVSGNFTSTPATALSWSATRGHDDVGALVIGANESSGFGAPNYLMACGVQECSARTDPVDLHNYSTRTPAFLSFWHMDRFARYDGAQVRAQVLEDETRPNGAGSWSDECILRPEGDYEGSVRHKPAVQSQGVPGDSDPGEPNSAYFSASPYKEVEPNLVEGEWFTSPKDFFISRGGVWEESWSLAVFPLPATCKSAANPNKEVPLLGHTVRFKFALYPGSGPTRGTGHGWLLDDVSIGPISLHVKPKADQRANLLDNTTKAFNVILYNNGTMPDIVGLEYDEGNSSAPQGSVRVPTEQFVLQPGERRSARVEVTLPRDPSLLPADFTARILGRSRLDPNAGGATMLDITFGPRQWAELSLAVERPTGIVQEATETFIPITIENNGLADSVDTRVRIVDEWAGGRIEHTLDLSSMPSYAQAPDEAMRILEFRWRPDRGTIGLHNLTFEVDPESRGEEYTRTNNIVSIPVVVSDLLIPDLHIANLSALGMRNAAGGVVSPALDADVARYEVTAGEVVSLDLRVANKGRAGATNVDVRAFIGALSLPPKTIPYIAPGTDAIVTFNWIAQKGEHELEFLVRSEQVELTTQNNRYPGRGVSILTVKGFEIGVDIPDVDGLLAPESEIRVPFRITNNGNAGEDLALRATSPSGTRIMLPREGFFLRAGETYEDSARLILDAEAVAGEQFITIDAIARENPMKVASGRAAMRVLASYGGSLAGGFALGAPPELVIPVELVNEGNSLEPWTLVLSLPAGWTAKETMPLKVVVPAHDRTKVDFHVTIPAGTAPGDRVLAVKAEMPNGEKREGVARVHVLPLRAAAVTLDEVAPRPDKGTLTLPVVVQNTGNVRQPFTVLLVNPPAGVEMRIEPAEFLLPPGGEAIATLVVKPNATVEAGTYAVSGYTRFEGVVPQTREGLANVQVLRVPVVRQEIKLTSLEFTPRAELGAGDRVTVKAFVQNFGQYEVANVPVHLFVDDVFIGESLIPTLAPGARVDVTFNWTALDGVHTLTAVVDPYSDTVDADREDNAVSALASVGVELPTGGIAAGRADAPMGGTFLALAAMALSMMVARRFGSWRRERR